MSPAAYLRSAVRPFKRRADRRRTRIDGTMLSTSWIRGALGPVPGRNGTCGSVRGPSGPCIEPMMKKKVQAWHWRHRDPQRGRARRAAEPTGEPAAERLPEAERIEGARSVRDGHEDFADTQPSVLPPPQQKE
jgi:hypothetical protein